MSVYQEAYATPSRVLGVYRYLLHSKGQCAKRQDLEELLMPEHLPLKGTSVADPTASEEEFDDKKDAPKRDMAKRTINEAIKMRLVASEGDDDLLLDPGLPADARSISTGETLLPRTLSTLLLSPENAANHDLAAAIAWYLGQDVYNAPSNWHDVDQNYRTQAKQLEMTNARFGQLVHWSRFLGFAWAHASPGRSGQSTLALVPDPYRQIRWRVGEFFASQQTDVLRLAAIATHLAVAVPVLEGGASRTALEGNLLPLRQPNQLSSSTAHAWLRLQEEGTVKLAYRSDGDAYVFPDGDEEVRYTEVKWQAADLA